MSLTERARKEAADAIEGKVEVFETATTVSFAYEVDPAYRKIVEQMASAMWDHDHTAAGKGRYPTGDPYVDDPYICRADDALREALPLLRAKFATELRDAS